MFEREGFVLTRMVDELLEQRQLARWCRTSVVFRMQGDFADQYRRVTIPKGRTAQEGIAHVRSTYGDKIIEIVNERIGA